MDPLRDPMNVLLALDHHSLATASGSTATEQLSILRWMIDFVDSGMVDIWYRDEASYRCSLQSLPNWAYSYSLALFQIHKLLETYALDAEGLGPSLVKARADEAIQQALTRFPSVVGLLLSSLEVDTTGRSFQRDWVSVLDATSDRARQLVRQWHAECEDTVVLAATLQSCDLIVKIFVQQNAKLWSDTETLQWLYDNLKDVVANYGSGAHPPPPNPAIMRYAGADPTDYDNKIQTLPPDANIINPAMLEHAMYMQPNRPRFLRHHMRPQNGDDGGVRVNDGNNVLVDANGNRIMNNLFMGPPTQVINPDWPMLEVFWRSFLPWNRVEGVPPARR